MLGLGLRPAHRLSKVWELSRDFGSERNNFCESLIPKVTAFEGCSDSGLVTEARTGEHAGCIRGVPQAPKPKAVVKCGFRFHCLHDALKAAS